MRVLILLLLFIIGGFSSFAQISEADKKFKNFAYADAAELYKSALKGNKGGNSDIKKKLAFCYYQMRSYVKAEEAYRDLFSSGQDFSGSDAKVYLYYAQVLANNGRYKESQEMYDKYGQAQSEDKRSEGFSGTYGGTKINELNEKGSKCYRIEYLGINTNKADFGPAYYGGGLVFSSARGVNTSASKRVFAWDNTQFLDLFLVPDKSTIDGTSAIGGDSETGGSLTKQTKPLGTDYYTSKTSNDTPILSRGRDGASGGLGATEAPTVPAQKMSQLNSKYHDGPVSFSKDGTKVFITRSNYTNGVYKTSADKINKIKLYTADNSGGAAGDAKASSINTGNWKNIQEVPFNSNEYSTGHATITADNSTVYFASDMPGGFGGVDIYSVEYNNGSWGSPINLGERINTAGNEMFPFVDEKGNLYFSSDGHPGLGGLDIFVSRISKSQVTKPDNLGAPLNSPKDDFGIIADADRKTGYFSSNRKNGGPDDDIYRFTADCPPQECKTVVISVLEKETNKIIPGATVTVGQENEIVETATTNEKGEITLCLPEKEYLLRGTKEPYLPGSKEYVGEPRVKLFLAKKEVLPVIKDALEAQTSISSVDGLGPGMCLMTGYLKTSSDKKPVGGNAVTLLDQATQQMVTYITRTSDGYFQFPVKSGQDYYLESKKEEYSSWSQYLGKEGTQCATVISPTTIGSNTDISKLRLNEGDLLELEDIYYDYGKSTLRQASHRVLDKVYQIMIDRPSLILELRSHTDSRSSKEFNQNLSDARARSAVNYLTRRGISLSRLVARGYGEDLLRNECADGVECSEEQHQLNRRTEIKVLRLNQ